MKRLLSFVVVASALVCTLATDARADLVELKWASSGYFRTRSVLVTNLAPIDRTSFIHPNGEEYVLPEIRNTSYLVSRLRITPTLSFANLATLNFQVNALDDVLWGDNNGVASAPLFATDGSHQNFLGDLRQPGEQPTIRLHKAWVQFQVPVGIMRVGRMPSHWGMGLLANGGGTANLDPDPARPRGYPQRRSLDHYFDDDFGDNHFGSVADRILFITKPITIAKTIAKKQDTSSKLVVGYAFDKISEAPLLRAEAFEREFRPFGQQGFISRGSKDDVDEHVFLAVWNDPYADFGGPLARHSDELRLGTYFVWRRSKEGSTEPSALGDPAPGACGAFEGEGVPCVDTGSDIFIADFWGRFRYGPLYAETEMLAIFGKSFGGLPFPSKNEKKKASINGGVLRLGYFGTDATNDNLYQAIVEVGHASGDDVLEDEEFKQRSLHPDYNVGLVLFEEVLRELSARTYGPFFLSQENPNGATGLFSNGGVINSNYINPRFRYHLPIGDMKVVAGLLFAWVDTLASTGTAMFPADRSGSYLGTEVDLALKASFAGNMQFSLETGYLRYGSALKAALPNAKSSFSLQSRIAFLW